MLSDEGRRLQRPKPCISNNQDKDSSKNISHTNNTSSQKYSDILCDINISWWYFRTGLILVAFYTTFRPLYSPTFLLRVYDNFEFSWLLFVLGFSKCNQLIWKNKTFIVNFSNRMKKVEKKISLTFILLQVYSFFLHLSVVNEDAKKYTNWSKNINKKIQTQPYI